MAIWDIFKKERETLEKTKKETELPKTKTPARGLPLPYEQEWQRYTKGGGTLKREEWQKEWEKFIKK